MTDFEGIVFGMDISNEVPVFNYVWVNKLAKSFFVGASPQWNEFPLLRKFGVFWKDHKKTSMEMEVLTINY